MQAIHSHTHVALCMHACNSKASNNKLAKELGQHLVSKDKLKSSYTLYLETEGSNIGHALSRHKYIDTIVLMLIEKIKYIPSLWTGGDYALGHVQP